MAMNSFERETVVNCSDGDEVVRIWTAQRRFITRLQRNPKATLVREGEHEGSVFAEFEVPASEWNPVSGIKRAVNMSDEQRQAAADRLAKAREQ